MDVKKICKGMSAVEIQKLIDDIREHQRTVDTANYKFEVILHVTEATTRDDDASDKHMLSEHITDELQDALSKIFTGVTVVSCEAK